MASLQCSPVYKTFIRQLSTQHRTLRNITAVHTPVLHKSFSSSSRIMTAGKPHHTLQTCHTFCPALAARLFLFFIFSVTLTRCDKNNNKKSLYHTQMRMLGFSLCTSIRLKVALNPLCPNVNPSSLPC